MRAARHRGEKALSEHPREPHMTGTTRSSEGLPLRRRRILWRAWHRGTREMDLVFGRFADAEIETLAEADLDTLEALMDVPDPDLMAWVLGMADIPDTHDTDLFARIRSFSTSAPSRTP
jgi:antitoxin CptB